jgi:hypothetical protein
MTRSQILVELARIGVHRFRIILDHPGHIVIEVPCYHVEVAQAWLDYLKPVGIFFEYRNLAWWRCWFARRQFIGRYV